MAIKMLVDLLLTFVQNIFLADREVQRILLELLNQMDGFDQNVNVKVGRSINSCIVLLNEHMNFFYKIQLLLDNLILKKWMRNLLMRCALLVLLSYKCYLKFLLAIFLFRTGDHGHKSS